MIDEKYIPIKNGEKKIEIFLLQIIQLSFSSIYRFNRKCQTVFIVRVIKVLTILTQLSLWLLGKIKVRLNKYLILGNLNHILHCTLYIKAMSLPTRKIFLTAYLKLLRHKIIVVSYFILFIFFEGQVVVKRLF